MHVDPTVRDFLEQSLFDFLGSSPAADSAPPAQVPAEAADEMVRPADAPVSDAACELISGSATELENECRQLLLDLGMPALCERVQVVWNPRLRSTAGYAKYPGWCIELNPRLRSFDGQVDRTLRHELAHLVAYYRAGRRRIEPHGREWRQACADLGIPNEPAHHRLPLPRSRRERRYAYQCPVCAIVVHRVRPFRRPTACLACCKKHSGGNFDTRFKFIAALATTRSPATPPP